MMRARDGRQDHRPGGFALGLLVLLGCFPAPPTSAAPATGDTTRVTYLAGPSVYVEAGRAEGLAVGDTLSVVRSGSTVARLRVAYLSTHRASCDTLAVTSAPQVGDLVCFTRNPARAQPVAGTASAVATPATAGVSPAAAPDPARVPAPLGSGIGRLPASRRTLRGRIGARYSGMQSRTAGDLGELGLDLRLDGNDLGNHPLDLAVDVRSRRASRTTREADPQTTGSTRVYRLSASLHGRESNRRITIGRQSSTALGMVSLFDGALAELGGERWTAGLFSGTQPDAGGLGLSSEIVEYGGFGEWRQPSGAARRWSLAAGAVASYQGGELNRDFLFVQGYYHDHRFTLSLAEEVDVNHGWKRQAGEPAISPTSTFLNARTQVTPALAIAAGFDSRRNVRLFRDRASPATEFDDRTRQGAWVGADADFGRHLRLGGDVRFHGDGTDAGSGHSWSVNASGTRLAPLGTRAGVRLSRFLGQRSATQLVAGTIGFNPLRSLHVELGGGARNTLDRIAELEEQEFWESADIDVSLGMRLLITAAVERFHGDVERRVEEQLGLSWRF